MHSALNIILKVALHMRDKGSLNTLKIITSQYKQLPIDINIFI